MGPLPVTLLWCAMAAVLLALALIDWDTTVLPDDLTLPLMWAGLVAAAAGWLPGLSVSLSLWGAVAG
jgi:leader peptidase (prepilin peptidase)/N-methyltransferase